MMVPSKSKIAATWGPRGARADVLQEFLDGAHGRSLKSPESITDNLHKKRPPGRRPRRRIEGKAFSFSYPGIFFRPAAGTRPLASNISGAMFARFPQAVCAIFSKPTISWLVGSRPPRAEYRGREAIHKKFPHDILLFQSITIKLFLLGLYLLCPAGATLPAVAGGETGYQYGNKAQATPRAGGGNRRRTPAGSL